MSETPDNKAGRSVEKAMARIVSTLNGRKLPPLDVRTYNSVYECVYEVIFREYPEDRA